MRREGEAPAPLLTPHRQPTASLGATDSPALYKQGGKAYCWSVDKYYVVVVKRIQPNCCLVRYSEGSTETVTRERLKKYTPSAPPAHFIELDDSCVLAATPMGELDGQAGGVAVSPSGDLGVSPSANAGVSPGEDWTTNIRNVTRSTRAFVESHCTRATDAWLSHLESSLPIEAMANLRPTSPGGEHERFLVTSCDGLEDSFPGWCQRGDVFHIPCHGGDWIGMGNGSQTSPNSTLGLQV